MHSAKWMTNKNLLVFWILHEVMNGFYKKDNNGQTLQNKGQKIKKSKENGQE